MTWNKIVEIGDLKKGSGKLTQLNEKLSQIFGKKIEIQSYEKYMGLGCRLKYLGDAGLIGSDGMATEDAKKKYPYAILNTTTDGAKECKPPPS